MNDLRWLVLSVGILVGILLGAIVGSVVFPKLRTRLDRWERPVMSAHWSGNAEGPAVAFIGASITAAWPLEKDFPDLHVLNAGAGWNLAGQELLRFRHDVLEHDPRVVVIKPCVTNFVRSRLGLLRPVDRDRARDALAMMVELCRGRGVVPVLCTPVPVGRGFAQEHAAEDVSGELEDLCRWTLRYGVQEGVLVADLYGAMTDDAGHLPPELRKDEIHPNRAGYQVMSAVVRAALEVALHASPSS